MTNERTDEDPETLEAESEPDRDEIILAQRRAGTSDVTVDVGTLIERADRMPASPVGGPQWTASEELQRTGVVKALDVIPMTRAEAEDRDDFEPFERHVDLTRED